MKKLILIGGVLASGKSTYSLILKEKLGISVINKDRLKEILGDHIIVNNREENKKLSVISFDLIKYYIENSASNLIIESNFKDYEMNELKKLVTKHNYVVMSLVFDAKNEILHQRFLNRLNENRHYVHKSQDFSNINDFIPVIEELRKVKYPGEVIKINCDNFDYQKNEELFQKVKKFVME